MSNIEEITKRVDRLDALKNQCPDINFGNDQLIADIRFLLAELDSAKERASPLYAYCQLWVESERGWGIRPDGFSLHLTKDDHLNYVLSYVADRSDKEVPDEYDRPEGTVFSVRITDEIYKALKNTPYGVRSWKQGNDLCEHGLVTAI